jgi:transcriptional regulator with XRE-family HTH domain
MRTPGNETAKALLADVLRLARQHGPYKTQADLASAVGLERTGITRAEGGEHVPTFQVLGKILEQCEVGPVAHAAIVVVWRFARLEGDDDEPVKFWFSGYLQIEAAASAIRTWHTTIIPGLLQTEDYSAAIFGKMGMSPEHVAEQVELRKQRQGILTRQRPPDLTFILWEPVLYHLIGSPEVMRGQLDHLLSLPANVVVQVVPGDTGGNAGLGGPVTLADGPKGTVLLAEALIEDQVTQDADLVLKAGATFNSVRADALPRAASRRLISEARESWNDR